MFDVIPGVLIQNSFDWEGRHAQQPTHGNLV
jgi:hypothetical protein